MDLLTAQPKYTAPVSTAALEQVEEASEEPEDDQVRIWHYAAVAPSVSTCSRQVYCPPACIKLQQSDFHASQEVEIDIEAELGIELGTGDDHDDEKGKSRVG